MKKIASVILLLALALCAFTACTSDPNNETESSEPAPVSTPEAESEVSSEVGSEPGSEAASEPEESSAVTEYYDECGRFVELDEQGNLKRVTDYRDDGSVGVVDDYENGVLVATTWYDGERVDIVMEFAPNGNPTLRMGYALDGLLHSIEEYNDRGVIVKETIFYDNGEDWILYEYKNGVQSKKTTYRENGEIGSVTEFDENGFSVKYIQYIDGVVDSYEEYLIDGKGNPLNIKQYAADGTFLSYTENTYDGDGNLVLDVTYSPEGNLVHVVTLGYDSYGMIVEQASYLFTETGAFLYGSRNHLDENGAWGIEDIRDVEAYELYDSIVSSRGN